MSFRERAEAWQAEAPARAAARGERTAAGRARDRLVGVAALALLFLLIVVAAGLLVLLVAAATGAWRILGAIVIVVVAGSAGATIRGG